MQRNGAHAAVPSPAVLQLCPLRPAKNGAPLERYTMVEATAANAHGTPDQKHTPDKNRETPFYRLLGTMLPKLRRRVLPHNRFGDNLYHRLLFLSKHKRLPGDEMLWNDVLYRLKTTDEILNPLRVFVSD